jgi:transposase InsO family protein
VRYEQIQAHGEETPVRWLCSALCVSPRAYYEWRQRNGGPRRQEERRLTTEIRACFEASQRTYGSPRIRKDLASLGYHVAEKRVARLMRESGLAAVQRRRFKVTTQSGHRFPVTPNVLARRFDVVVPNQAWVADITYIATEEGWLYLAALMDLYSRRIVGWNAASRIDRWLTLTALERALRLRQPPPGLVHHSDQGSPYAAYEYQERLRQAQAISSMSRKGDCYDNAAMESFFSSLKRERIHRRRSWNRDEGTADIHDYIANFYNPKRRHSHLGGLSPVDYENRQTDLN